MRSLPSVTASRPTPKPAVAAPATRNGHTGSPYSSAIAVGKRKAGLRYLISEPTRLSEPDTSTPSARSRSLGDGAVVRIARIIAYARADADHRARSRERRSRDHRRAARRARRHGDRRRPAAPRDLVG